jgi:hypothetical protein
MTYSYDEMMQELETRFERGVRQTFDQFGGLPVPFFILIAQVNPQTGKRFDTPTPCPVALMFDHGMPSPRSILDGVKRQVVLTEAVAAFCAYACDHGVKLRCEFGLETWEWLLPVLTDKQQEGHYYLGKRIAFANGSGLHARTLDELDTYGGVFDKTPRGVAEA